jgi:VWFA-related protein
LFASLCFAQNPTQPSQPRVVVVAPTETKPAPKAVVVPQPGERITLNVVAFDSHDQIAGDLTSQDFQISDEGKTQRIVSFHNNVPNAAQVAPPVVLLFDLLHDGLGSRGYGAEEIIRALETLRSSDSLYLYLLSSQGELKAVRGLPSPQEHNPPEKTPWTEHIKPLLEAAIDNAYGVRPTTLRVGDGVGTVPAIEKLNAALRPFPGRKNLIWITSGANLNLSYRTSTYGNNNRLGGRPELVNRIATALDHDDITLSSVHQGHDVESGDLAPLEQFAELTGGKVYDNDIEKAVKEVMAASRSGYVIEYDGPPPDGKYHKIRVTCFRKGVHLQVKQGYYAN